MYDYTFMVKFMPKVNIYPTIVNFPKFNKSISNDSQFFQIALVKPPKEGFQLSELAIICEFPKVFPDDLPSLPPDREIEFTIDLEPRTRPIYKAPYCMALRDLRELHDQLDELS